MSKRAWRVVGAFHGAGEVVVVVTAPNWQGGLRKGALAIKALPQLKGRRITVGSFTIQETETLPTVADPTQLNLPEAPSPTMGVDQASEDVPGTGPEPGSEG